MPIAVNTLPTRRPLCCIEIYISSDAASFSDEDVLGK